MRRASSAGPFPLNGSSLSAERARRLFTMGPLSTDDEDKWSASGSSEEHCTHGRGSADAFRPQSSQWQMGRAFIEAWRGLSL